MINVILVDDHRIFRQGIARLFDTVEDMDVVAETGTGEAAIRLASQINADVIVMDISLPDISGIDAGRQILNLENNIEVVLLSMHRNSHMVESATMAGIKGYVVKDDAFDNLIYAIRAVTRGERFINLSLTEDSKQENNSPNYGCILTKREKEIVGQISEGYSSKEIAQNLYISVKTVETHRARIMEKLEVKNMAQLVKFAVKTGIIKP